MNSQVTRCKVRCADCRDSRKHPGEPDFLGWLKYWPGQGFDWVPFERYSSQKEIGLRRAELSEPDYSDVQPFTSGRDFGGSLKVICRHGHDRRANRANVLDRIERAYDDTIWL